MIREGSRNTPVAKSKVLSCSRPHEEFVADFCLVGRRALREAQYEAGFQIWTLLYEDMLPYRVVARKLRVSTEHIEQWVPFIANLVGRRFRELEPFALFPLCNYFTQAS